jgi:hypothetical protein
MVSRASAAVTLPKALARPRVRRPDRLQQLRLGGDALDDAKRRGVRRDRTEQGLLVAHRAQIGDALAAVGEHHGQVANDPARIMTTPPLFKAGQPPRQRACEPELVGDARQQRAARVREQPGSVRRDFYGYPASITHHLQGEPPSRGSEPSTSRRIPAQPDVSAPPPTGGAGVTARPGLAPDLVPV